MVISRTDGLLSVGLFYSFNISRINGRNWHKIPIYSAIHKEFTITLLTFPKNVIN